MLICNLTHRLCAPGKEEEALDLLKAAGFDAADLSLFHFKENPRWNRENYKEEAKKLGDYARAIGLPILQAHAEFAFDWKTADLDRDVFPVVYKSAEVAAIAGAENIVVHPIHPPAYDGHEEEYFHINMEFYGRFLPLCETYGVRICTENMFRMNKKRKMIDHSACSRPEDFIRYVDTLEALYGDHFGGCLDLGHMVLVGVDPIEMIQKLGHRINCLHVHDNNYHDDSHLLSGLGSIEMEPLFKALGDAGYHGIFTLEAEQMLKNMPKALYPDTLSYMAKVSRYYADLIR